MFKRKDPSMRAPGEHHPAVGEMKDALAQGKCDRREFLRTVTLLGVSAPMAYGMASYILGDDPLGAVPKAQAQTPKKGGTLRVSMVIPEATDPATFDWVEKSNSVRHQNEFLVMTGPDNITRPYLAKKWEASDDLKTWTFHLRKDVRWHNGDKFNADDVVFNLNRWLDPATGSSNLGLFSQLTEKYNTGETDDDGNPKMGNRMRQGAVERVDDHTVRLHLSQPALAMAENFYNYPTMIVHRDFKGDLTKERNGTGPFQIAEFRVGEKVVLKRAPGKYWGDKLRHRDEPYWGGRVYLDEIHYIDHGAASAAQLAAYASGQVDAIYEFDIASLAMASSLPNTTIYEAKTAQTGVVRMRLSEKPFDNKDLRDAIVACVDAGKYRELVFQGRAAEGEHHHVSPIHPEYFPLPKLRQDHAKARQLLAKAGYPDGIDLTVDVGNTNGPWQQNVCEVLKEQLAPAGIRLSLNVMPSSKYWEIWATTPFGLTAWTHRPLGTMVLSLGYRSGVPWNETAYANPAFDAALDKAEALVDVEERKKAMEEVERILQQDAIMVQPLWQNKLFVGRNTVHGLNPHPTQYHQFNKVWIDS